jgi:DNA polymerase-3 subunit gamma/tau
VKSSVKVDAFLSQTESDSFRQALSKWSQVLQQVKERRITVHAWLVDGELVSATEEAVLLAFKSGMHRDTTEKPAHKEIIESVISEVFGAQTRLTTIMMKDWKDARAVAQEPAEELRMEAEAADGAPAKAKEEWIEEAVQLFGEELVVIKD